MLAEPPQLSRVQLYSLFTFFFFPDTTPVTPVTPGWETPVLLDLDPHGLTNKVHTHTPTPHTPEGSGSLGNKQTMCQTEEQFHVVETQGILRTNERSERNVGPWGETWMELSVLEAPQGPSVIQQPPLINQGRKSNFLSTRKWVLSSTHTRSSRAHLWWLNPSTLRILRVLLAYVELGGKDVTVVFLCGQSRCVAQGDNPNRTFISAYPGNIRMKSKENAAHCAQTQTHTHIYTLIHKRDVFK